MGQPILESASPSPRCLVCHSDALIRWATATDEEYWTTKDPFAYYRCQQCRAISIDPVPSERLAEIYPSNYYSFDQDISESLLFRIKNWLDQRYYNRFVSPLGRDRLDVLDVGGGNGAELSSLRRLDPRITRTVVVDLDPDAGAAVRERGHEFFCGRIEEFSSDQPFDIVLMLNLIEHVENPVEVLSRTREILAPEGLVFIKTPNTDALDARLFRHRNWGGLHCPRHWSLFDAASFERAVASAGYSVLDLRYTQGAPFWTTSVLFALQRKGWIRIDRLRPAPQHPLYAPLNALFAAFDLLRRPFAKTSQMMAVLRATAEKPD